MRQASRLNRRRLTLIDIDPGAVTRLLDPYFPIRQNWKTRLLAPLDRGLRSLGRFPVVCHEVHEIRQVFAPLDPAHLYVLYADPDVAHAVPEDDLVIMNPTDIRHDSLLELGDVVFCYNTLMTAEDPKRILDNLLSSVKVGGLLSTDAGTDWSLSPSTNPMFIPLSEHLFLKEF
ncbi:MAG: hypothetical protein GHCLOJNM_04120 [bacterium]|nr:hypothetical protein [bacterium]